MSHDNGELCKTWREIELSFQNFDLSTWKSLKNFILMYFFWAKHILFELKKHRGVIFHETEEGCKSWSGIDLLHQNWRKEFELFWPEHSKVSNVFTLIGSLWAKHVLFKLKNYREVIFHEIEEWCKIFTKADLLLGK